MSAPWPGGDRPRGTPGDGHGGYDHGGWAQPGAGGGEWGPTSAWPAPQPAPAPAGGGNTGLIAAIAVVATLLVITVIGAAVLLTRGGDEDRVAEVGQAAGDRTIGADRGPEPTGPGPATVTETVRETATAAPDGNTGGEGRYRGGANQYGVGLNTYKQCSAEGVRWVGTGHSTTSCPFATNVGRELSGTTVREGSRTTVRAHSPTTGKTYDMACRKAQDSEYDYLWKCTGGVHAVVYVYP